MILNELVEWAWMEGDFHFVYLKIEQDNSFFSAIFDIKIERKSKSDILSRISTEKNGTEMRILIHRFRYRSDYLNKWCEKSEYIFMAWTKNDTIKLKQPW